MNIGLIQFAVQSIVRLGIASREAAEQRARNTAVLLPGLDPQNLNRVVVVNGFFNNHVDHQAHVAPGGPLAEFWDGNRARADPSSVDSLYVAALRISASEGVDLVAAMGSTGAVLLEQFDPGKGPVSPFARIALTAADLVLEYLAVNPGIVTEKASGRKLLGAFAGSLASFLPDDGSFGPRERFAERLVAGFLRAGLATLSTHPDWVVEEEHVEKLLEHTLVPLVAKFPASIAEQIHWNEVIEALIGSAAQAALETVAAHQAQFLGRRFDADGALGAVTQALFLEAAEDGLRGQFSRDELVGAYRAVAEVAATRPQLFIDDGEPTQAVARAALQAFAGALAVSPPPFDKTTGLALARAAIEASAANAHRFADPGNDWHGVAIRVFEAFARDLSDALEANTGLSRILTRPQLTDIGRIVLTELSANPTLITRDDEWRGVIASVTAAMAADDALLLTGDDWQAIAAVAAAEAAENPARLFKLEGQPEDVLAARLMTALLKSASAALATADGRAHSVLVGRVLREAIVIALHAAAGTARAVMDHLSLVEELVAELNRLAITHHLEIGGKAWLHLFRVLLGSALAGRAVGDLTLERAMELLQGG